jgi:hypothetical protein
MVMGPSVNMSARMMGKAPSNQILCDEAVKHTDTIHQFIHFANIQAKGYDHPVPTFTPIIISEHASKAQVNLISKIAALVQAENNNNNICSKSPFVTESMIHQTHIGRNEEFDLLADFLQDLTSEKDFWKKLFRYFLSEYTNHPTDDNDEVKAGETVPLIASLLPIVRFLIDEDCRVVVVNGSHGVGKSHFLQDFFLRINKTLLEEHMATCNIALHFIPQLRLKTSEPFSGIKPLIDTIVTRFLDWTAGRYFDPLVIIELNKRTKTKAVRGFQSLLDFIPQKFQLYASLMKILSPFYDLSSPNADEDLLSSLATIERLDRLGMFLYELIQTYQKQIGRLLFLNM